MNDIIEIKDLQVYAYHGVLAEENELGQNFYVSAKLYTDFSSAAENDDLSQSVDYSAVCKKITELMTEKTCKLIETVANNIAEMLLLEFPLLKGVWVKIKKPSAPIGLPVKTVAVSTEKFWHKAYISFGSNMGNKMAYIDNGIKELNSTKGIKVIAVSEIIETTPYGDVEQDNFLNGCLEIQTFLSPEQLLAVLNNIEANANRERLVHWGPRTLDLDIIFYDNLIIDTEKLHIPHIDMHNREFVLKPLSELASYYRHPVLNKTVAQLLQELEK